MFHLKSYDRLAYLGVSVLKLLLAMHMYRHAVLVDTDTQVGGRDVSHLMLRVRPLRCRQRISIRSEISRWPGR